MKERLLVFTNGYPEVSWQTSSLVVKPRTPAADEQLPLLEA